MWSKTKLIIFIILVQVFSVNNVQASEYLRIRIYFGLSLPQGNSVSLDDWNTFEKNQITKYFDGFNVVNSTGYYKGKPERSKIVTIVLEEKDIPKAKKLARIYAEKFNQESVMVVTVPVVEWTFETSAKPDGHL